MNIEEIVEIIYAERYQPPNHEELASTLKQMIREISERAIQLHEQLPLPPTGVK